MNNSSAKVVLDSVGPNGKRLVSVEARYWRAIHAEIMTHRDRARNAASSRAIPFIRYKATDVATSTSPLVIVREKVANCTYSYINNDPFMPEFLGAEQKGMQSGGELQEPNRSRCLEIINDMRLFCLDRCEELYELGLHKSVINRYLEPWSYITVIMTATEWKNFFRLRIHPKAEKHFNKVAGQIKDAIDASTPTQLSVGEWHMPYLTPEDTCVDNVAEWGSDLTEKLKKISAARCARLSYLTHDGKRDIEADLRIFDSLIHPKIEGDRDDDVIHSSPLEHVAQAGFSKEFRSGPFVGWKQFRKEFPNENVEG